MRSLRQLCAETDTRVAVRLMVAMQNGERRGPLGPRLCEPTTQYWHTLRCLYTHSVSSPALRIPTTHVRARVPTPHSEATEGSQNMTPMVARP